jgi:hypothetical protein
MAASVGKLDGIMGGMLLGASAHAPDGQTDQAA